MLHLLFPFPVQFLLPLQLLLLFFLSIHLFHLLFELFIIEPADTLAIFPEPCPLHSIYVLVYALTMLLSIFPLAGVLTIVGPSVDSETMLLVIQVLTLVTTTIRPREDSLSIHIAVLPLTLVNFSIFPRICSYAIDLIIEPVSIIHRPICISIDPFALLTALMVLTLKRRLVSPSFFTKPMLHIILPITDVTRAIG